ncbi:MAG TPA: NAD(P)H-dependent oxidoreductase [Flavobacteriaceae bacterium]|nr:NAD(P)H-dependent oxidoreductase [Flavobacteriaceae bacterium]
MKKDLLKALSWRYATKTFDPEITLSKEQIDRIVEAFNLTATSFGLQPVKLFVVKDKGLKEQLTEASWGQNQVRTASHVLVFCIKTEITPEYIHDYFNREEKIRSTDPSILKPYRKRLIEMFEAYDKDKVKSWATNQAYLTMGNVLTFCASEGIDSSPMEGFDAERVDTILELQKRNLASVLLLPIGKRSDQDFFASLEKVRKPIDKSVEHL